MRKLTYIFFIAVIALAIALLAFVINRPEPGLNESSVRDIVKETMGKSSNSSQNTVDISQLDQEKLNLMIEEYLVSNPRILETMSKNLQAEIEVEKNEKIGSTLIEFNDEIYKDPDNIILGNPNGKISLVEFFDYNCPFCKQVMPHIPALIEANPDLKIIIKEFPILGQNSLDVARLSIAVHKSGADYWEFHEKLFELRGTVTLEKAKIIATEMGLELDALELVAKNDDVTRIIQNSYAIAQALDINGTPAFILGQEIIPGAVELEQLQLRVDNMRKCAKTQC